MRSRTFCQWISAWTSKRCAMRLCRKVAFKTICTMVSPGDLWCTERENDDGDQFQGSPLSAGDYSDGGAVVCRLPLELPACRRADAGTRCAGRPRDHSAVGGEIQPAARRSFSPPQAPRVDQLAHGSVPDATGKNALVPPQALCIEAVPPEGWSQKGA